ncbi:LPXTG cell wall anchor domain-containing protein [Leuconostoc pseudomesenteroides]|uniref:LPXTG cell wall anchor domain-containing protein n=1 Tax=Leuconostoc pseudomesenteroides TaxID=33968 RepID=UPI0021AA20AA|nr:LPXTG cell wall anchor domain-containing protein [Leuconostoc pseudomesenteroides]MCT4387084.1 LPXTG cell wall anchor domain-containing protein [Leuconostoc pseudomesenteroides]
MSVSDSTLTSLSGSTSASTSVSENIVISTAVDQPEYVVAGNIVPQDEHGNPVGPEIPYGPVKPGTTVDTPYGDVEVPGNGGDVVIQIKTPAVDVPEAQGSAVDVPEYVVAGNIVPQDEHGNPVGPEIPYGPVKPGTTVDTPYGDVEVPGNGGDVVIQVKVAVDQPEYVLVGNIVPEDENGNSVGPKIPYGPLEPNPEIITPRGPETPGIVINTPYGPVEVPVNGGDIIITVATEVPGIAVYEKTAVDQPEYVVVGNIVPQDENGNPVGPEIPYGPVAPETTIDTPYGDVEVPANGGDIIIQVKTAVDQPEYVVVGNIVPEDENGNPVGPEIPYGPVTPGTTIDTPYGSVIVPDAGGDVVIVVKVETNKKSPISNIKANPTTTQEVMLPVASSNNDGQPVNIDHSENTDKQLPKTSVSQNNDHVVISGLILTTLLGLLALLKRKNNN